MTKSVEKSQSLHQAEGAAAERQGRCGSAAGICLEPHRTSVLRKGCCLVVNWCYFIALISCCPITFAPAFFHHGLYFLTSILQTSVGQRKVYLKQPSMSSWIVPGEKKHWVCFVVKERDGTEALVLDLYSYPRNIS